MWTIYYDSVEYAKYKITLYADHYMKHITGPLYSIWIVNNMTPDKCLIGETGEGYAVYYYGLEDFDKYFGVVRTLGWDRDVRDGLPDTDPRVKKIIENPDIKKLLDRLLFKYRYKIITNVFDYF